MKRRNPTKWDPQYKTRPWWTGNKSPGVQLLCAMFRVQQAPLFRAAVQKRKSTKKGHKHVHSIPGAKMLKKFDPMKFVSLLRKSGDL